MSTPGMLSFRLVVPAPGIRSARRQKRKPAAGLSLVCTRIQPTRLHGTPSRNLCLEFRDAGAGGIRFVSSEPLPIPCPLRFQIRQEATGRVLAAEGVSTWIETRGDQGRDMHVIGARFDRIATPPAESNWFLEEFGGTAPTASAPEEPRRRGTPRFEMSGCDVTLERDHRFRGSARAGNLASRMLDLSRSGVQVLCKDPLSRGEVVRITVDVRTLQEIFSAEAEVTWVRHPGIAQESNWRVGLAYRMLGNDQQRQLLRLEHWCRGARNPSLRAPSP